MNCYKCGEDNEDGVAFCKACGAELSEVTEEHVCEPPHEEDESRHIKIIASGIACVFGVLLLVWCISGLIGCITEGGYEKPFRVATQLYSKDELKEKDIKKYIEVLPELKIELMEEVYQKTGENYTNIMIEQLKESKDKVESLYGENVKMTYKILDREKLEEEELEDLEDMWNNYRPEGDELKISSAYSCCVKFGFNGKKDKDVSYSKIIVCRVDGDWCFYSTDLGMFNGNIL